jgi:lysophospholipase L1-like esterase
MKTRYLIFFSFAMLLCFCIFTTSTFGKDPQLEPKRLASIGDSITEAIDAEVYGANHWAGWANGYHDFWQWLFGLSDVDSHNQRITEKFGRGDRKNFMEAESGADSFDLSGQATQAVAHEATYVPWLMGHNDICQDDVEDIPTREQFEANALEALEILRNGLPHGATIYVVGMADVPHLYDIAKDKKVLGIVDCEELWFTTLFELFPCGTVLGPFRTDADRDQMRERIIEFNAILQELVEEFDSTDTNHYYFYTNEIFDLNFLENQVSDLDCFHPSPDGQEELSRITWESEFGPNFQDW